MNLGSLFDSSVGEFSARFWMVMFIPSAGLILLIGALLASGAPGAEPSWAEIQKAAAALTGEEAVLVAVGALLLAMLSQPLQYPLVRVLEGYWGPGPVGTWLARPLVTMQRAQMSWLSRKRVVPVGDEDQDGPTAEQLSIMTAADVALRMDFPPAEDRVLPTKLGNVLRATEDRAGQKYALETVTVWPHLYSVLPEEFRASVDETATQLDVAVRLCFYLLVAAIASVAILYRYVWWLLVPVGAALLAFVAYRSAIAAARSYGKLVHAAFDIHRFELLKAFRAPQPRDLDHEIRINKKLTGFLLRNHPFSFDYKHDWS